MLQPQAAAAGGAGAAGAGGGGEAKGGDASLGGRLRKKPPVWQIIKHNIYTHRARKEQVGLGCDAAACVWCGLF